MPLPNPFLGAVMRAVRSGRPILPAEQPFFTRVERVPAGNYVEVWFRTAGCTWDHAGGCTMCNYGHGSEVSSENAVETVRAALEELAVEPHELMVSPSGGMWDPKEVPLEALPPIYELARAACPRRFLVETRAETVNSTRIGELHQAFPQTSLAVELGLESSHDAVLTYCVNKGSTTRTFEQAAELLTAEGIAVYANVCLGTALLDRVTAVRDALASVRWALTHGADTVVLFPLHVKPFTLLEVLQRHGRYHTVSLWDLVEVLHALGPEASSRIEIAWYKSYYDVAEKVATSPVGCAVCTERLMVELDRYRATQDYEVIAELARTRCVCAPELALESAPPASDESLAASVLDHYAMLAATLGVEDAWRRSQPRLESAVRRAFDGYLVTRTEDPTRVA